MTSHCSVAPHVGLAALLLIGCARPTPRPRLPTATGTYRLLDNAVEVQLPDSCGYVFNGQQVPTDSLVVKLQSIFAPKDSTSRAIFVVDNPRRAWTDVERVADAARAAGGWAFDARSSGRGQGFTPVARPPGLR